MKLIINCTSLNSGGGIQVALSLIEEFKRFEIHEFHVIYTESLANQLNINKFPKNFIPHFISNQSLPYLKFLIIAYYLKKLEKEIVPEFVFTIFGPSYWRPKVPHLMGYALGHFLYPDSPFWKIAKAKVKIGFYILKVIKIWQMKKNAEYFHIETEDAKLRLNKYYKIPLDHILVASNSYHQIFNGNYNSFKLPPKKPNEFRLVTISAYYSHKNLRIINSLINELEKTDDIYCKFYVTLPTNIFEKHFIKSDRIYNLGPVKIEDCPSIYVQSDALFLPTLLEIFSASYIEAMKMNVPILTSDLPFANNICKDAALYFDPFDAKDIAKSIIRLAHDKALNNTLKEKGRNRLAHFDNSNKRAENILSFCENIIRK
jgi:glycosyltransferase involved in cell wall biosynthesis